MFCDGRLIESTNQDQLFAACCCSFGRDDGVPWGPTGTHACGLGLMVFWFPYRVWSVDGWFPWWYTWMVWKTRVMSLKLHAQELCHRFSGSVCREGPTICKPLSEFDSKAWKLSESSSSCVQDVEPFTVRSAFVQLQICVAACSSVCHLWLCRNMSNVLAIFDG